MSKPTYYELLKDPRWQKKRLEIMEASGWQCVNCGTKNDSLNVHHGAYLKGLKPWEYPNRMLHCLCDECHTNAQAMMECLKAEIGAMNFDYLELLEAIAAAHNNTDPEKIAWHEDRARTAFQILIG
jgi:hypothetical protein